MDLFSKTVDSLWQVVVIGLVLGAGLPTIFALGVRFMATRPVNPDGSVGKRSTGGTVAGVLCFTVVLVAVVTGILFVMKDFLDHDLGIHLF